MADDHDDRLSILERAQLLHDATLRRHGDLLDRLAERQESHAAQMARHEEVMLRLAQTLDAIKDLLERRNGRP